MLKEILYQPAEGINTLTSPEDKLPEETGSADETAEKDSRATAIALDPLDVSRRKVWTDPLYFIAFGFGSGLIPKAPGTWGTLVGLIIYVAIAFTTPINDVFFALFVVMAGSVGVVICEKVSQDMQVHDHGGIVWDEMVGIWLVLIAIPDGWYWLLLAFILFRVLDIAKPWPISFVDRRLRGGMGIMLDDVLAGLIAWLLIQLVNGYLIW
jgi:phosphatidylglycerophosphatase A